MPDLVLIVLVVIFAGAFEVDASNWSPCAPHGFKAIITGATVVFFCVGFDAVANSAEESKRPQTGYSVVSACFVTLRWRDKAENQVSQKWISSRHEGVICLVAKSCCGFAAGLCHRYNASYIASLVAALIAMLAVAALHYHEVTAMPSS